DERRAVRADRGGVGAIVNLVVRRDAADGERLHGDIERRTRRARKTGRAGGEDIAGFHFVDLQVGERGDAIARGRANVERRGAVERPGAGRESDGDAERRGESVRGVVVELVACADDGLRGERRLVNRAGGLRGEGELRDGAADFGERAEAGRAVHAGNVCRARGGDVVRDERCAGSRTDADAGPG